MTDAHTRDPRVRAAAESYLQFLYTLEAQEIIARQYYRPFDANVLQRNQRRSSRATLARLRIPPCWRYGASTELGINA